MTPELNNEPGKEVKENAKNPALAWLQDVPMRLFKKALHNWPWKLLSVFLAVCLWAGLITQDPSLTRERVFTDVPLNTTGADTLRRNGMIVIGGLEAENMNVRMRVEVPQREYNTVVYTNYNPRIDLTRITQPGEQQVKITSTSTSTFGTVEDITPATMTIVVDEYVTNYRVPVSVNTTGSYPEGFYGSPFSLDPSIVAVSGPKSVVDQIARIYVDYDASSLKAEEGTLLTAMPMRFVDRSGNDIVSDLLEVTSSGVMLRSINVKQTLYPLRELPISQNDLITGEPARGWHITDVTISPASLRAAGEQSVLDDLQTLFAENTVSVNNVKESFTTTLRIRKPAELEYLSSTTVNVSVTVEPVIISSSMASVRINARGTGGRLRVGLDSNYTSLVITGPQTLVESIRPSQVSAYVDVTGLSAGEYMLPLQFHVEDTDTQSLTFEATPSTIKVNVYE